MRWDKHDNISKKTIKIIKIDKNDEKYAFTYLYLINIYTTTTYNIALLMLTSIIFLIPF